METDNSLKSVSCGDPERTAWRVQRHMVSLYQECVMVSESGTSWPAMYPLGLSRRSPMQSGCILFWQAEIRANTGELGIEQMVTGIYAKHFFKRQKRAEPEQSQGSVSPEGSSRRLS